MNEELSYEEEQLQLLLLNEMKQLKLNNERSLKQKQDEEYFDALQVDEKINEQKNVVTENVERKEISLEEMRRIRLLKFSQ